MAILSIRGNGADVTQRHELAVADVLQFYSAVLAAREITRRAGRGGRLLNCRLRSPNSTQMRCQHQFGSIGGARDGTLPIWADLRPGCARIGRGVNPSAI